MGLNGAFTVNYKYTSVSKNFLIITQLKIFKNINVLINIFIKSRWVRIKEF